MRSGDWVANTLAFPAAGVLRQLDGRRLTMMHGRIPLLLPPLLVLWAMAAGARAGNTTITRVRRRCGVMPRTRIRHEAIRRAVRRPARCRMCSFPDRSPAASSTKTRQARSASHASPATC